jgi:carbon-monoxide dehydrogenase small subunit
MNKITVHCTVNHKPVAVETYPNQRLLDMLRNNLGLTSVKEGCSEGECGACTVIYNGEPVTSCCVLAGQAEGADIITLEGVSIDGKPDVVQQAFIDAGAIQCGFCIPGMILTAEALLMHNPNPTLDEVKLAMSGNLCRCTGYAKINDAVMLAAERKRGEEAK